MSTYQTSTSGVGTADKRGTRGLDHEDEWQDEDEEDGFAAAAVKSFKCLGVKCASTGTYNTICCLPQANHVLSVSNSALLSKSVLPKIPARASILRTNNTVFPQHALVVSDTFQLSQAHEAHERAVSWETSPRAWLSNVRAIEMYNGLIPVPDFSGAPIDGLTEDDMSELLELRAEKKSSWNISVKTPLEGSSDDGISNILHSPLSIHLIRANRASSKATKLFLRK